MGGTGKYQRLEIAFYITIVVAFCVIVAVWDNDIRKDDWLEIKNHAKVIEENLWDLDVDGPKNYLQLASKLYNYEQLTVYSLDDEIFLKIEGPKPGFPDKFLIGMGLIPRIKLQADIVHKGMVIGRIEAVHLHDSIYPFSYFFVVVILVLLSLRLFFRTLKAKNVLKLRVRERTEELAEEKERLAVTLRSIGDGVIATDLDGNVILLNKISEQLTGWSQDEATGKPAKEIFNIINEKTGESCENPVEKIIKNGQTVGLADYTVLIARDGTRYIVEDSGAPIFDKNNKIIGTVLVYRDVTRERRIREELLKIKKLESVGVLAGGIAHDFNNLLAAILGNIELAGMYTESTSEARPLLIEAKKASIRAKGLTKQLLTFSKGGDPVKQNAAIKSIITDSADFVLHGSSVIADYSFSDDLWQVKIDTGQISQVVQNIILNAVQAMPDGGAVEICCRNLNNQGKEIPSLPVGEYIEITVVDTGSGIPEKFIDKIFDPYFSTKPEGSGLGLAVCHSIIQKHDGTISVKSEENEGTTFTIYLPACSKCPDEAVSLDCDIPEVESQATVLVMDDDAMVREMVKKMLTRCGHKVILAENGYEAIECYKKHYNTSQNIDVVIMDLTIPGGMGGKDAVPEILKINPQAKVVVASGYSNDPVMAHYRDYGFAASLDKPFIMAELKEIINAILLENQTR